MSVARQIDCIVGDGTFVQRARDICESFGEFLDYCETQGLCTRIAFQNGDSGAGSDWSVGSAGDDCFACYRFDQGAGVDFYVLIQAANSGFGGSPGDPGRLAGASTAGFGVAMAIREDGGNPWNGTTNNNGSDSKGDPVWIDGGSTLHVFPMSNNDAPSSTTLADYDQSSSRQNMVLVGTFSGGSNYHRFGFWASEECVFLELDAQNNGAFTNQTCFGRYTPHSHMSGTCTFPYFMICSRSGITGVFELGPASSPPPFYEYGSRDGNGTYEGGVLANPSDGVIRGHANIITASQINTTYQPNQLHGTPRYELVSFVMNAYEEHPVHRFGGLGVIPSEVVACSYNVANLETNAAFDIAVFSNTTTAQFKTAKSWDGGAAPSAAGNTTGSATGRQSFTA